MTEAHHAEAVTGSEEDFAEIEQQLSDVEREKALEPGKDYGECESCGQTTVLVAEVSLCGPCCFGEASTLNGNW